MRVLVATDGSRGGTAAVRFAARLAACDQAVELTIITVDSGELVQAGPEPSGDHARNPRQVLEAAARALRRHGIQGEVQVVKTGPRQQVPDAIAREADRRKVDLVVVGSEGRDTLREWVVGGTALRLIYLARRPVTVVRPSRRRTA